MIQDHKLGELRAYTCGIKGMEGGQIINARSRGKAKYIFYVDCDIDFPFTLVTCRVHGPAFTSEAFTRNALYRNIPFAYVGMRVHLVGVGQGVIVSHNSSANLNVLFDDGQVQNCHPNWMMKYFDDAGRLVAEFGKGVTCGMEARTIMIVRYIDGSQIADYANDGWDITFLKVYLGSKLCFMASRTE